MPHPDELPEEDQFGRMRYLELCREMGISPASQILKYLESEAMHVVHYGGWPPGWSPWVWLPSAHWSMTAPRVTVRHGYTVAGHTHPMAGRRGKGMQTAWVPRVRAVRCTPAVPPYRASPCGQTGWLRSRATSLHLAGGAATAVRLLPTYTGNTPFTASCCTR